MPQKGINIESAAEIIAKHSKGSDAEASWPTRCAVAQILLRNADGRIIATDFFMSASIDAENNFDTEAQNPLAIHATKDGAPIGEYSFVNCKFQGKVRPSVARDFTAFVADKVMDPKIPAKDEEPVQANPLAKPTSDVAVPS